MDGFRRLSVVLSQRERISIELVDMASEPVGLTQRLIEELIDFQNRHDFLEFFKSYSWREDTYGAGFPDILRLERMLTESDGSGGISLQNVRQVAAWGKLRNPARIKGEETVLPAGTLRRANALDPTGPLRLLESSVWKGVGPTYMTKILRFGRPREYGAIDTRCVRVFGKGDQLNQQHNWLDLRARNDGYGWYIPKGQSAWPSSYGKWISILRFFSQRQPAKCPHPPAFVQAGLRVQGEWACADIEMTLFAYASQFTK